MKRFQTFLVDELGVCRPEEVANRVFFVSAKEVLHQRMKARGLATPTSFLADGYQARSMEFGLFEEHFETLISRAAIHTKFESHIRRGKELSLRLHDILQELESIAAQQREGKNAEFRGRVEELKESQRKLLHFITQSKDQIMRLSAEVQLRVSEDFRDAIRRLEGYIDSYHKPFSDDPKTLPQYKADLIKYIDDAVSSDLNVRFTGGLRDSIERTQRQMIENIRLILPEAAGNKALAMLTYREPFRFTVTVDCAGLSEDFVEDLEFRFSLGFSQLVRRLVQLRRAAMGDDRPCNANSTLGYGMASGPDELSVQLPRGISSSGDAPAAVAVAQQRRAAEDEDAMMKTIVLTSASYVANGGVGLLLIGGLVYRTLGWRVIAVCGGAYVGVYLWERARWNSHAKEQQLKDQLRRHLASRLKQLSQIITCNCDAQVTREVQEVLARLQSLANDSNQELKGEIEQLNLAVDRLTEIHKKISATKLDFLRSLN